MCHAALHHRCVTQKKHKLSKEYRAHAYEMIYLFCFIGGSLSYRSLLAFRLIRINGANAIKTPAMKKEIPKVCK